jgi:P pilus assembly chaperone PapD
LTQLTGITYAIGTDPSATFYNITNGSFNSITTSTNTTSLGSTANGYYWVLRNNSGTYLSITPTAGGGGSSVGIPNPLLIPPGNSATLVWSSTLASYYIF